jgi:hypothetical protein
LSDYPATPQWLIEMRAERARLEAEAALRARWARIAARQEAKK